MRTGSPRSRGPPSGAVILLLTLVAFLSSNGASAGPTVADGLGLAHPGPGPVTHPASFPPAPASTVGGGPTPTVTPAASFVLGWDGATPAAISLNWTNPGSGLFSQYSVQESTNGSAGPWTTVGVVTSATTVGFVVTSLTPGAPYWWEIVETYGLFGGSTLTSNVLNHTQPTLAFLSASGVTSTSATLTWTNNATYGGPIQFAMYQVYEGIDGSTPSLVATISAETTFNYTAVGLASGTGYTFYVLTSDCVAGCGTGSPTLSATQSNSVPLGTAFPLTTSISSLRAVFDVGQLAYFTCTPSGGVSPFTFSWDFGSGVYVPGNGSASTTYSVAGSPVVHCRVVDGSRATSTAGLTLLINARPHLIITLNRTGADVGESVSLAGSPSNGTPPFNLGWTFGDGASAAGANATHSFGASGVFVVTCSGADLAGVDVVNSSFVTVSPSLGVSIQVTSASAAPGTAVTFDANPSNGSGNYTAYDWSFGDAGVASGRSANHAYASAGTFSASVRVLDSNGIWASDAVVLTIAPVAVALSSDPATATAGSAVTFTAVGSGGAGAPYNYTWTFGDGATAYGSSASHTFRSAGTFHPSLRVTDRLGAQNVSALTPLVVSPAAPPLAWVSPWVLLAIGVAVGLLVGGILYSRRRSEESEEGTRMASYVPPTDPSRTVSGSKVCRFCETPNLPIRKTCVACGKPLPRFPGR